MKSVIIFLFLACASVVQARDKVVVVPFITKPSVNEAVIYLLQHDLCMIKYGESCFGDSEQQYQELKRLIEKLGGDTNISPPSPNPE